MTVPSDVESGQRLRQIAALTDARLSRLPGAEQVEELLDRVRTVLGADTAVVLLLDPHSQQMVVTAARGLEEEVSRRIRIPVGTGFAGRIADTSEPVIIDDATEADVASPVLLEIGVRSLLGVPMFSGGSLIGVLHAGSSRACHFTTGDVDLLQLAADRVAAAAAATAVGIDRDAALVLQRSLLPTRLPEIAGTDLAARYVPGHRAGVGGDWYDVFGLPDGTVGVVIGDVSGHGLGAAVVMGRLRSALRSYALTSDDPATVLDRLDRKMHHFEAGHLATVAYGTISADRATLRLSLAGHLPPVLAVPGQAAATVDAPADPPLGVWRAHPHRRVTSVALPVGALLFCYTDGLVERREEIIDDGIARLAAALHAGPAESACTTAMRMFGAEQPADDIAMLAVRRSDLPG